MTKWVHKGAFAKCDGLSARVCPGDGKNKLLPHTYKKENLFTMFKRLFDISFFRDDDGAGR